MTSRELLRWSRLHERRARSGATAWLAVIVAAAAFAVLVYWRAHEAGPIAASKTWLAGALAAFALAFMRVPFHLYWRPDAALLAQLPIGGGPLVARGPQGSALVGGSDDPRKCVALTATGWQRHGHDRSRSAARRL